MLPSHTEGKNLLLLHVLSDRTCQYLFLYHKYLPNVVPETAVIYLVRESAHWLAGDGSSLFYVASLGQLKEQGEITSKIIYMMV